MLEQVYGAKRPATRRRRIDAVVEAARPPGVTGKYTALQSWFSGALRSQIQCCHCGHESNTQDPFLDLSLELRAVGGRVAPDLDGAMTQFCQEEFLDGANKYKCEACGKGHCSAEALRKHRSRVHKPVPKPVAEEPDLDAAS